MAAITEQSRCVLQKTGDEPTRCITEKLRTSLFFYANHPEQIGSRLRQLEQEWDMERCLEANMSTITIISGLLAMAGSRRSRIFQMFVAGFMLQHATTGWCPPASIFRYLGIRTKDEIIEEHYALRMLRGDFDSALKGDYSSTQERVEVLLAALEGEQTAPESGTMAESMA